jgi:protein involved in ribonucleotide reduction
MVEFEVFLGTEGQKTASSLISDSTPARLYIATDDIGRVMSSLRHVGESLAAREDDVALQWLISPFAAARTTDEVLSLSSENDLDLRIALPSFDDVEISVPPSMPNLTLIERTGETAEDNIDTGRYDLLVGVPGREDPDRVPGYRSGILLADLHSQVHEKTYRRTLEFMENHWERGIRPTRADPDKASVFWIEAGFLSGGSKNQLEIPQSVTSFFTRDPNREVTEGDSEEIILKVSETSSPDRKVRFHPNNQMPRVYLPTDFTSEYEVEEKYVLFRATDAKESEYQVGLVSEERYEEVLAPITSYCSELGQVGSTEKDPEEGREYGWL